MTRTPDAQPSSTDEVERVAQQWLSILNGHPVDYPPSSERIDTVRQVLEAHRAIASMVTKP
jgi:hypothetical protein